MKKLFKLPKTSRSELTFKKKGTPSYKSKVKIEIRSAGCPPADEQKVAELMYRKYNFNKGKIKKLIKIPWALDILNWKTIVAKTADDGVHYWRITENYKKGCYIIRVTKLPAILITRNPRDSLKATSQVFYIFPIQAEPEKLVEEKY